MEIPPRALTPPQLARFLGVGETKVLGWIRRGELKAVNLATSSLVRPYYHVLPSDLEKFLAARTVVVRPKTKKPIGRPPRREPVGGFIDYCKVDDAGGAK